MKFGLVHRIMTDALAALGLLSLVTSGELDPWMTALIVAGLVAAIVVPERLQDHPRAGNIGAALSIALLATQLARLLLGADILKVAIEFAAGLQVVRLGTRRGAAHDQQIILLALVHLVAGTVLGSGLAYGLCFFGFLVVAPGALVLSHLRREVEGNYRQGARDRTGLPVDVPRILRSRRVISRRFLLATCSLSIPIFLFTALLFVLFPRVGLSLLLLGHSRAARVVGFSDHVDLGGVGKLRTDPTIAMRVYPANLGADPAPRLALYLRGTAFDAYDGRTWARTQTGRVPADQHGTLVQVRPHYGNPARDTLQIDLEPISPPVVLLPPDAVAFRVLARGEPVLGRPVPIVTGPEGEFRYSGDERGLRYEVILRGAAQPVPERLDITTRNRYLALPPRLPPRIAELARTWTQGANGAREAAVRVEHHLRSEFRYDLDSPSGGTENPLDHFLFESHRGHCEFYSTAMAVLLRTLGIPTRNVTGFVGGTYNRFGHFYAVRQGDAHSWVEAYLDGEGWTQFDPTPPASAIPQVQTAGLLAILRDMAEAAAQRWNRYVIGYDLEQQLRLVRWMGDRYGGPDHVGTSTLRSPRRLLILAAGLGLLWMAVWYWLRRRRHPRAAEGDSPESAASTQIVALYRALETAMAARGAPRVSSVPPLTHAENLRQLGHPIAPDVLELTQRYIEVRYAGRALSEQDRRDYSRRVRDLTEPPRPGA